MNNIQQKVEWYRNYESIETIYKDVQGHIEEGWRVHACLERRSDVLVIYEKSI